MVNAEKLAQQTAAIIRELYDFEYTEEIIFERPRSREHGDWALNIAMKLAKSVGLPPRQIAEQIALRLAEAEGVEKAEVAGPGFVNLTLDIAYAALIVPEIVEQAGQFGRNQSAAGRRINLEFISGNPTGPLHLAHTRWGAVGDSMVRVLSACGAEVTREYYVNDVGNQMNLFAQSVYAAARGLPTPENGYPGEYITQLADRVKAEKPGVLDLPEAEALPIFRQRAYELQIQQIKDTCERFRVHFDVWFSEAQLHEAAANQPSQIDQAVRLCEQNGCLFEAEGAKWVRTTEFGDDKDRVIVRSDGTYTYYAADVAYYLNKRRRGYTELLMLMGADHHGYVSRIMALAKVLESGTETPPEFRVLVGQMVSLQGARLSKRAGTIIELADMIDWIGADALRFWLCRYPIDTPLDLNGDDLRKQSNDNPVYYVQYAHARTCAVARNAEVAGIAREAFAPQLLVDESEKDLVAGLHEYSRIVEAAGRLLEPHRVVRYLEELAGLYHRWYDRCRVIPREGEAVTELVSTRLWLNAAAGQVLANGLELIGVSAPERM